MSKFSPCFGALYVSIEVSASGTEVSYCLPSNRTNLSVFREICRMVDYVVYPRDRKFRQTNFEVVQKSEVAYLPVIVYWRKCTFEDLSAVQKLWQKKNGIQAQNHVSFNEWQAAILADPYIPQEVKLDLRRVHKLYEVMVMPKI